MLGVLLHLQGVEIIKDFIPISLGSTNVILGIQCLETLGVTFVNWKTQLLKFRLGSSTVSIKGDPPLGKTLISLKAMLQTIRHEGHGVYVELNHLDADHATKQLEEDTTRIPGKLEKNPGTYSVAFSYADRTATRKGSLACNYSTRRGCTS